VLLLVYKYVNRITNISEIRSFCDFSYISYNQALIGANIQLYPRKTAFSIIFSPHFTAFSYKNTPSKNGVFRIKDKSVPNFIVE